MRALFLASSCIPTWWRQREREHSPVSSYKGTDPLMWAPSLWPVYSQRPHLQITSHWRLVLQHRNFGGTQLYIRIPLVCLFITCTYICKWNKIWIPRVLYCIYSLLNSSNIDWSPTIFDAGNTVLGIQWRRNKHNTQPDAAYGLIGPAWSFSNLDALICFH